MIKAATVSVSEKVIGYLNKIIEKSNKTLGKVAGEIIEKLLDDFTAEELTNEIKDLSYSSEDKIVCVISPNINPDKFTIIDKIRSFLNLSRSEVLRALLELTLKDINKLKEEVNLSILKNSLSFIKNLTRLTGKPEVLIIFRILEVIYEDINRDTLLEIIKIKPPMKSEELDDIKVKLPLNAKQHFEELSNNTGIMLPYIVSRVIENFTSTYTTDNAKKILFPEFIKLEVPKVIENTKPKEDTIVKVVRESDKYEVIERKRVSYSLYTSTVCKLDALAKKFNRCLESVAADFLDGYIDHTTYPELLSEAKTFMPENNVIPIYNLTLHIDEDNDQIIEDLSQDTGRSKVVIVRNIFEKIFEKRLFRLKEYKHPLPYTPRCKEFGAGINIGLPLNLMNSVKFASKELRVSERIIISSILNSYNLEKLKELLDKEDFKIYQRRGRGKSMNIIVSMKSWENIINLSEKHKLFRNAIMTGVLEDFFKSNGSKDIKKLILEETI